MKKYRLMGIYINCPARALIVMMYVWLISEDLPEYYTLPWIMILSRLVSRHFHARLFSHIGPTARHFPGLLPMRNDYWNLGMAAYFDCCDHCSPRSALADVTTSFIRGRCFQPAWHPISAETELVCRVNVLIRWWNMICPERGNRITAD